jgi:hypothetical protein
MSMKKPSGVRRAGDVAVGSGEPATVNLDAGSRDQITWQRHVLKRLCGEDAGNSLIVRRALDAYTRYLERLVQKRDQNRSMQEAFAIRRVAKGEKDAIPEEQLIAVPVRPFSEIRKEASDRRFKARPLESITDEELRHGS